MICKAKKKFNLAPNTEVTLSCGLDEVDHLNVHHTRDMSEGVTVIYQWDGEFAGG